MADDACLIIHRPHRAKMKGVMMKIQFATAWEFSIPKQSPEADQLYELARRLGADCIELCDDQGVVDAWDIQYDEGAEHGT